MIMFPSSGYMTIILCWQLRRSDRKLRKKRFLARLGSFYTFHFHLGTWSTYFLGTTSFFRLMELSWLKIFFENIFFIGHLRL